MKNNSHADFRESPMKVWMVQNKELPEDTYFYQATSEEDALDQHAQMAGYADFSEALEYNPGVEFNVRPIEKHEYVELDVVNHLIKMRDNLANDVFRVSHELSQIKEELHAKIRDLRMQIRTCHDENKQLREALNLLRNSVNEFKTLSYEKGLAAALMQSGLSDALAQANAALEAVSK